MSQLAFQNMIDLNNIITEGIYYGYGEKQIIENLFKNNKTANAYVLFLTKNDAIKDLNRVNTKDLDLVFFKCSYNGKLTKRNYSRIESPHFVGLYGKVVIEKIYNSINLNEINKTLVYLTNQMKSVGLI